MKNDIILLTLVIFGCFALGCSNDEPAPIEQEGSGLTNYGLNKKDSLFVVDMIRIMKEQDALPESRNWLPEDVDTWNYTTWGKDNESGEFRLNEISIAPISGSSCTISSKITDCEYLNSLILEEGISEVPQFICDLNLTHLHILHTDASELPDNIFSENMVYVRIEHNRNLTRLPSSITKLSDREDENTYFSIVDNNFTGEIPPISKAHIIMSSNQFTSIKVSEESLTLPPTAGVYAIRNNLSGFVPNEILNDTVKLNNFHFQVKWQNKGYGFNNMPSDEELEKQRIEWNQNHPDMKL